LRPACFSVRYILTRVRNNVNLAPAVITRRVFADWGKEMVEHNYLKKVLFRLRWMAMSDRDRYAYLWRQTRGSVSCEHRMHSRYTCLWSQLKERLLAMVTG